MRSRSRSMRLSQASVSHAHLPRVATPAPVTISCSESATIRYSLDGFPPGDDATLYTGPFVVDHNCYLRAVAVDAAGNEGSVAASIAIGDTGILLPSRGSVLSDATPLLRYYHSGIDGSETVTVDGVRVDTRYGGELPELADGRHEIVLTWTEYDGGQPSDAATFEVDTVAPTVSVSPPGVSTSHPSDSS